MCLKIHTFLLEILHKNDLIGIKNLVQKIVLKNLLNNIFIFKNPISLFNEFEQYYDLINCYGME